MANAPSVPNSWTSPTVVQVGDSPQILTSGSPWVIAYDPSDGRELYRATCLGGDVAPTQIFADGKILAIEPYNSIVAIRTDQADGDITNTHLAWRSSGDMPDICSPVSNGSLVWTLSTSGSLTAFNVTDGNECMSIIWTWNFTPHRYRERPIVSDGVIGNDDSG